MAKQRRKSFNYKPGKDDVVIERLAYEGEEVTVAETVVFTIGDIPEELQDGDGVKTLASYGLSQILQDRTSALDADDRLDAMKAVYEQLKEGVFKARRESTAGPRKASIDPYLAAGFAAYLQSQGKDVTPEAATAILQTKMDAEGRKAIRQHEDIKPFIEKAKQDAEAAADSFDLDSLFG